MSESFFFFHHLCSKVWLISQLFLRDTISVLTAVALWLQHSAAHLVGTCSNPGHILTGMKCKTACVLSFKCRLKNPRWSKLIWSLALRLLFCSFGMLSPINRHFRLSNSRGKAYSVVSMKFQITRSKFCTRVQSYTVVTIQLIICIDISLASNVLQQISLQSIHCYMCFMVSITRKLCGRTN